MDVYWARRGLSGLMEYESNFKTFASTGIPNSRELDSFGCKRRTAGEAHWSSCMAQLTLPPPGFDQLSAEEKREYIQALWDHVSEHPDDVPLPDWHREIVAERLAAYRRGETSSRPWHEVREELLARLSNTR